MATMRMATTRTTTDGDRRREGARRLATTLVLAVCVAGASPGCGEGFIVGGLLGIGAAVNTGSPEAVAGCAVLGEAVWFSMCAQDPGMPYFDSFFFQQVDPIP